jgi:uncharacterized protein
MNGVFLDTVGLLGLWNSADQWHLNAVKVFTDLAADRSRMLTTEFVLLECGNAAARWPIRSQVVELRNQLLAEGCLIRPTDEDLAQAWDAYHRGLFDQAGIVDEVSFVVMRRLGLTRVFSSDNHFRAARFETLL